jgi:hypothetical protein
VLDAFKLARLLPKFFVWATAGSGRSFTASFCANGGSVGVLDAFKLA